MCCLILSSRGREMLCYPLGDWVRDLTRSIAKPKKFPITFDTQSKIALNQLHSSNFPRHPISLGTLALL